MDPQDRRQALLDDLKASGGPLTGQFLAERYGVTRQVIVQDVALLRAHGFDILATPQGYLHNRSQGTSRVKKTVAVKHGSDPEVIEAELNTIVDLGGKVLDVIVEHPVYGEMHGLLMIDSRRDVQEFLERLAQTGAEPLLVLTDGVHLHTLEADDFEILENIEEALKDLGMRPW